MAVYEHHYKPYEGKLTPTRSRFLVIPRYAYQDLFKHKLFIGLYVVCFVCPLIYMILIYLRHNASLLTSVGASISDVVQINEFAFYLFTYIQCFLAFIFTVIIGPVLISRDLANNALPLYLCRPFSRFEYLFGKMSVLLILLSSITWVPGLLLFFFEAYLEGGAWLAENWWIASAIFIASLTNCVLLTLLSLTFSALIKWRLAASAALFAIFTIPTPIAVAVSVILRTTKVHLLNPAVTIGVAGGELFRQDMSGMFPAWQAWAALITYAVICIWLLARKVRAYEVVSS